MDMETLMTTIAVVKTIPETAVSKAEAAAYRAEEAADTVESATIAETKTYLGIA